MLDRETTQKFVADTKEALERIKQLLLSLDNPEQCSEKVIVSLTHEFASIKRTSSFFNFSKIQSIAQRAESISQTLKMKAGDSLEKRRQLMLNSWDVLNALVQAIKNDDGEAEVDCSLLITSLNQALRELSENDSPNEIF